MLSTIVAGFINIEIVEFFYQNYMIINYISYFLNIAGITQDIYRRLVNDEKDGPMTIKTHMHIYITYKTFLQIYGLLQAKVALLVAT
jgi:hypothetical protein